MKKSLIYLSIFIAFVLNNVVYSQVETNEFSTFIVKMKSGKKLPELQNTFSDYKIQKIFSHSFVSDNNTILNNQQQQNLDELSRYLKITKPINQDFIDFHNELIESGMFDFVEPNYTYSIEKDFEQAPNDSLYTKQWSLKMVNAEKAWQKATGKNVIVAVVDTGIDYFHPDLVNSLWINNAEDLNGNGRFDPWPYFEERDGVYGDINWIDDSGNGYIDDVIGYDFIHQKFANFGDWHTPDPFPNDELGHGTLVSGIIAAETNNNIGIAGLAFDAKIMTLRAFDATGNGEADDIAASIVYAALNGAKVLNFSFGEQYDSKIMHDAIKFAYSLGCVMVTSSGNNNWTLNQYPSMYDEVINAGGINQQGFKFGQGNYGSMLDISAPAEQVLTTAPNGEYQLASGTSMAAPYVSATAALLWELNPDLSPSEIRGILNETALDKGERGWDVIFGSGILDAGKAVENISSTILEFSEIYNEATIYKNIHPEITLKGTVLTPLFDSYQLFYGEGILPNAFIPISDLIYTQKKEQTLGTFNISELKDTVYTISIKVNLKNNHFLERRLQLNIASENSPLEILTFKHFNAYYNQEKIIVASVKTNRNSNFQVRFRPKGTEEKWKYVTTIDYFSTRNLLYISDEVEKDLLYEAEAIVYVDADTAKQQFEFIKEGDYFTSDAFVKVPFITEEIGSAYLNNFASDINNNGKQNIAVSQMPNLAIESVGVFECDLQTMTFNKIAGFDEPWIPFGFGDTNGDGINEVILTSSSQTRVYQSKNNSNDIFENLIYQSTVYASAWGEHIIDINGNGRDDIIAMNDTSLFVISYVNNSYETIARANIPEQFRRYGLELSSGIGDITGNGKTNLVVANRFGNLFVFEYTGSGFEILYIDSTDISIRNQSIKLYDIDNDGKKEIVQFTHGDYRLFESFGSLHSIWNIRILKAINNNEFEVIADENIFGVRAGFIPRLGFSYRNSLSGGNLVNEDGAEIVVSTFPNLYVFKWVHEKKRLNPLWHFPASNSTDAIIHNFGTNKNKLGFNSFEGFVVYEYNGEKNRPSAPFAIKGRALNSTEAFLEWEYNAVADYFQIYKIIRNDDGVFAEEIENATTIEKNIVLANLQEGELYEFVVAAFNSDYSNPMSGFSDIAEVFMQDAIQIKFAQNIEPNIVYVGFNGKLPMNYLEPTLFDISNADGKIFIPSTAIVTSDTALVLLFTEALPYGLLTISNEIFKDYYGNHTLSTSFEFEHLEIPVQKELFLTNLEVYSSSLLKLFYSEPVISSQAGNINNYILEPFGEVFNAEVDMTNNSVYLNINLGFGSNLTRGTNYSVRAINVRSVAGNPMTKGAGSSMSFVLSASSLKDTYVFPNPIEISKENEVYFGNLSARAEITIMTLEGKELAVINEIDGNGGAPWNLIDFDGNKIKPGIYMYKVTGEDSEGRILATNFGKFAVIP